MKVFFNTSARGMKSFGTECNQINDLLWKWGYYHTFSQDLSANAESNIYSYTEESLQNLYTEATRALTEADIVILELSIHSFTQGFLVKKALDQGKPVIGLYHDSAKVAFALGIDDDNFQIYEYNLQTLAQVLKDALEYAQEKSDIRFNMMISSKLNNYLKWVSRDKKTSRAAFVRSLIQKHLENNDDFKEK